VQPFQSLDYFRATAALLHVLAQLYGRLANTAAYADVPQASAQGGCVRPRHQTPPPPLPVPSRYVLPCRRRTGWGAWTAA
jgi:hypothetical protein